jgi:hypothetical protein
MRTARPGSPLTSSDQLASDQRLYMEPPSGFEPETYALRDRQSFGPGFIPSPCFTRLCRSATLWHAGLRTPFTAFHDPSGPHLAPIGPLKRPQLDAGGRSGSSAADRKAAPSHPPSDSKGPYPAWVGPLWPSMCAYSGHSSQAIGRGGCAPKHVSSARRPTSVLAQGQGCRRAGGWGR